MLNRRTLPSRCPPIICPSLRPYLTLIPHLYVPKSLVATFTPRERVSTSLNRQRERAAYLAARIGPAKILNERKQEQQEQRQHSSVRQSKPTSGSRSVANLYRIRKYRSSRAFPTRPLIELPHQRQRSRGTRAQSRRQGHLSVHLVKRRSQWPLSHKGSGRSGGENWFRRVHQIGKPSRSTGPHRTIKRTHWVSLGLWPKRTSWISSQSTTDSLEEIKCDWTSNFQTLKIPVEMQRWTSLDTMQMLYYYGGTRSAWNPANEEWMGLHGYNAERLWRNVMLWCLKYEKRQALMLLLATFKGRKYRPPRYVVSDCLESLARYFLLEVSPVNPTALDIISVLTCKFIDGARDQEQSFPVSQHLVHLVLRHSDDLRVLSFYGLLGFNKAVLHVNTMLHFLDRFLDMGRINLSMKLLGTIAKTNFDLSYPQIQMACVKLLRARFDTQDEYTVRSNILSQILDVGIRPKIPMFNAILLNASEGGDFVNAWKMYGLAKEDDALIPDSVTYRVLLKGAILSGELFNVEMVVREIQTNGKVLQDLRLVSDVLNAISLVSPIDAFFPMLDFYKQHCDLRPLQELSLCGDETQAPPGTNCSGVWPTSYILTHMILAYIRLNQGSPRLIHNYTLYYHHVKENHPLLAPLAEKDIVPNSFVMAFGMRYNTLQYCTTVVKHMLEFSSSKFTAFDSVPYAAPTVQTWSILVAAYFRHRQKRAAEKVHDMMRERGIRGDKVTWNTLVRGYASLQDVSAAVDTVKEMKATGLEVDNYTIRGLGKLWSRERSDEALKMLTEEPSIDKGISEGRVPPLGSEEVEEASKACTWRSTILNRRLCGRRRWRSRRRAEERQQLIATA